MRELVPDRGVLRDVEVRGGRHGSLTMVLGRANPSAVDRRGPGRPALCSGPWRRRTRGWRPARQRRGRRAGACRRSSCASCATASSSPCTAGTSSRSTPRADDPPPGRPGPGRQPALDRQAVRAHGAPAGRRPPGVRPHDRRAGDHGVQPLRRGPPRPHDPGDVPPDRDHAGRPRDRRRGHAARRPDGRPPGPRRRAPGPLRHMCSGQHSVFILLAKLGGWELETYWQEDHPAHAAYREAVARRLRGATRPPRDRHRRLRDPDLRLPAARGRAVVRDPRRPRGRSRTATRARPSPVTSRRSATR